MPSRYFLISIIALGLAAEPALASDRWVSCIQEELVTLGFNPGPIDGLWGRRTADALDATAEKFGRLDQFDATQREEACNFLRELNSDRPSGNITEFSLDLSGLQSVPESRFDFSNIALDETPSGRCEFEIYRHRLEDPGDDELMSAGIMAINSGNVQIIENEWFTGGLADETFLRDLSELKLDKNGHLHGSMPYFHMFIGPNDLAAPPETITLGDRTNLKKNDSPSGQHWFHQNTWADGYIDLSCTKVGTELPKSSNAKIAALQSNLSLLGYEPGPADGAWGARTAAALDAFRATVKSAETGDMSDADLMMVNQELTGYAARILGKSNPDGVSSGTIVEDGFHNYTDLPWTLDPYYKGPSTLLITSLFKGNTAPPFYTAQASVDQNGWTIIIGDVWAGIKFKPGVTPPYRPGRSDVNRHRYFLNEYETRSEQFSNFIQSLNINELSRLRHICAKFSDAVELETGIGHSQHWYSSLVKSYFEDPNFYSNLASIGQQCGTRIDRYVARLAASPW